MNLDIEHPWVLILLLLAALPFMFSGSAPATYSWLSLIPRDGLSRIYGLTVRVVGSMAIAALVFALSGVHRAEQYVERVAEGAQIAIVLDRSRSMNDTFAGESPAGEDEESKAEAASRLLLEFTGRRSDNVYGVVEFTTSPIYALPLTAKPEAVKAAMASAGSNGLALTNIASPLMMAAGLFAGRTYQGSRVILLVSDGAAKIDEQAANLLRDAFQEYNVRLYWIYIRTEGSPGIVPQPGQIEIVGGVPEQELHEYFQSLEIPYTAYEADDPVALQRAVADMDNLERWALHTTEVVPRQSLSIYGYGLALLLILMLGAAKFFEVKSWR